MLRRNISLFVLFVSLLAFANLNPVQAQGAIKLSRLEVDLWPEYDRPSVLVIYHIALPASVSLPADLSLRIPAESGDPSAVAVRQVTAEGGSGLFTIPFERQVVGEWGVISLTATMPEVQLEYYDPGLTKEGNARQFEFNWAGDYAVDALILQVQQPVGASQMALSPSFGSGVTGSDGMVYYNKEVGVLAAEQTFSLTVNYQKSSDDLSAASLQVQPSAPVTSITPGQNSLTVALPWVLGGLGVVLIVGGGAWYYYSGRQKPGEQPRRRRRAPVQSEPEEVGGFVYCHQCGKRASPGDVFCRTCGTKMRTE